MITHDGEIVKITNYEQKHNLKLEKLSKLSSKFIDLKVSDENYYALT